MARKTVQISGNGNFNSANSLSYEIKEQDRKIEGFSDITNLKDKYLVLKNNKIFSPSKVYMLTLKTKQYLEGYLTNEVEHPEYSFDLVLASTNDANAFQTLKTVTVGAHSEDTKKIITTNCIFQPLINFDKIILKLHLTSKDLTQPREITIENTTMLQELQNILSTPETRTSLERVGLQGKPGAIFAIDGEEMRLNKNGIYEVTYDNLDIQHIGWVQGDFLLDITYTYTQGGN